MTDASTLIFLGAAFVPRSHCESWGRPTSVPTGIGCGAYRAWVAEKDTPARRSAMRLRRESCHTPGMTRSQNSRRRQLTKSGDVLYDFYDYATPPSRLPGRTIRNDPTTWIITDDRSENVPVTDAEIDVFEAWFGDLFDELFSTRH